MGSHQNFRNQTSRSFPRQDRLQRLTLLIHLIRPIHQSHPTCHHPQKFRPMYRLKFRQKCRLRCHPRFLQKLRPTCRSHRRFPT